MSTFHWFKVFDSHCMATPTKSITHQSVAFVSPGVMPVEMSMHVHLPSVSPGLTNRNWRRLHTAVDFVRVCQVNRRRWHFITPISACNASVLALTENSQTHTDTWIGTGNFYRPTPLHRPKHLDHKLWITIAGTHGIHIRSSVRPRTLRTHFSVCAGTHTNLPRQQTRRTDSPAPVAVSLILVMPKCLCLVHAHSKKWTHREREIG